LATATLGGKHYGDLVAAWSAKYLRVELFPWQVYALSGQLQVDDNDRFVFRESLVSTARQNGKSVALCALIGWFVTDYAAMVGRPVNVLSTANQLDRAEAIFSTLAPVLVEYFDGKQLQAIGRKQVQVGASSWQIRAATTRLHGGSFDLIVVDELWNIPAAVLDEALRPSMIARPSPLLSCWSTAGDASSTAMINMREKALADIEAGTVSDLYFAEWSMPADVSGPDYWGYANPSLGYTITTAALKAAQKHESFARAHLNQWITARGAWLEPGEWEKHKTTLPMGAGGVLAVDSSIDEARYVGVRAATVDGRVMVDVAFVVDTEDAMWAAIEQVMADKTVTLAVTPTLELHLPTNLNRRFTTVGYGELLRYTSLVRSMITEGRVIHSGHRLLAEHVTRAVGVKTAQGFVLSSQKSPGVIELARCAVWAISLVSKPVSSQRPVMVVAN
jgi:phage terminase large subunit-like protein